MSLFKKQQQSKPRLQTKTNLPSGVAVRTVSDSFLVKNNTLLRIPNERVWNSWNFPIVLEVEWQAISHYPILGKLGFRDGTILEAIGSRKLYLVSAQKVRHIETPDLFEKLGISYDKRVLVSDEEINLHKEGEPIGII